MSNLRINGVDNVNVQQNIATNYAENTNEQVDERLFDDDTVIGQYVSVINEEQNKVNELDERIKAQEEEIELLKRELAKLEAQEEAERLKRSVEAENAVSAAQKEAEDAKRAKETADEEAKKAQEKLETAQKAYNEALATKNKLAEEVKKNKTALSLTKLAVATSKLSSMSKSLTKAQDALKIALEKQEAANTRYTTAEDKYNDTIREKSTLNNTASTFTNSIKEKQKDIGNAEYTLNALNQQRYQAQLNIEEAKTQQAKAQAEAEEAAKRRAEEEAAKAANIFNEENTNPLGLDLDDLNDLNNIEQTTNTEETVDRAETEETNDIEIIPVPVEEVIAEVTATAQVEEAPAEVAMPQVEEVAMEEPVAEVATAQVEEATAEVAMAQVEEVAMEEPVAEVATAQVEEPAMEEPFAEVATAQVEEVAMEEPVAEVATAQVEEVAMEEPVAEVATAQVEEAPAEVAMAQVEEVAMKEPVAEVATAQVEEATAEVAMAQAEEVAMEEPVAEVATAPVEEATAEVAMAQVEEVAMKEPVAEVATAQVEEATAEVAMAQAEQQTVVEYTLTSKDIAEAIETSWLYKTNTTDYYRAKFPTITDNELKGPIAFNKLNDYRENCSTVLYELLKEQNISYSEKVSLLNEVLTTLNRHAMTLNTSTNKLADQQYISLNNNFQLYNTLITRINNNIVLDDNLSYSDKLKELDNIRSLSVTTQETKKYSEEINKAIDSYIDMLTNFAIDDKTLTKEEQIVIILEAGNSKTEGAKLLSSSIYNESKKINANVQNFINKVLESTTTPENTLKNTIYAILEDNIVLTDNRLKLLSSLDNNMAQLVETTKKEYCASNSTYPQKAYNIINNYTTPTQFKEAANNFVATLLNDGSKNISEKFEIVNSFLSEMISSKLSAELINETYGNAMSSFAELIINDKSLSSEEKAKLLNTTLDNIKTSTENIVLDKKPSSSVSKKIINFDIALFNTIEKMAATDASLNTDTQLELAGAIFETTTNIILSTLNQGDTTNINNALKDAIKTYNTNINAIADTVIANGESVSEFISNAANIMTNALRTAESSTKTNNSAICNIVNENAMVALIEISNKAFAAQPYNDNLPLDQRIDILTMQNKVVNSLVAAKNMLNALSSMNTTKLTFKVTSLKGYINGTQYTKLNDINSKIKTSDQYTIQEKLEMYSKIIQYAKDDNATQSSNLITNTNINVETFYRQSKDAISTLPIKEQISILTDVYNNVRTVSKENISIDIEKAYKQLLEDKSLSPEEKATLMINIVNTIQKFNFVTSPSGGFTNVVSELSKDNTLSDNRKLELIENLYAQRDNFCVLSYSERKEIETILNTLKDKTTENTPIETTPVPVTPSTTPSEQNLTINERVIAILSMKPSGSNTDSTILRQRMTKEFNNLFIDISNDETISISQRIQIITDITMQLKLVGFDLKQTTNSLFSNTFTQIANDDTISISQRLQLINELNNNLHMHNLPTNIKIAEKIITQYPQFALEYAMNTISAEERSLIESGQINIYEKLSDGSPKYIFAVGEEDGVFHIYQMSSKSIGRCVVKVANGNNNILISTGTTTSSGMLIITPAQITSINEEKIDELMDELTQIYYSLLEEHYQAAKPNRNALAEAQKDAVIEFAYNRITKEQISSEIVKRLAAVGIDASIILDEIAKNSYKGQKITNLTSKLAIMLDSAKEEMPGAEASNKGYSTSSPLSLDLDGNGINTTDKKVKYDIDGDGVLDLINDSADAVLVFDADGNGIAGENGREVFGNNTDLDGDGVKDGFANGFEALKALALKENLISENDNQISAEDIATLEAKYGLAVKIGYTGEAKSLSELGITAINLSTSNKTQTETNFDGRGNTLMTQEGATFEINGITRNYADIWHLKYETND